jgi:hypothetical protein
VSGVVAAHGSSLQRVLIANGTVAWSVDLCHFIQGPLGSNSSPCYVATAGASLLNIGSRSVPLPVVLVPVADAKFGPALIVVDAHNGTLVTHVPLSHQQSARARTAPLATVAAPPLGIASANLSVVPAPELGLTAMFGVNVSASARPRVLWESELLPQRFGVTLREKDIVWACNFSLCGASFVSGHQTFKSEGMRCPGDEGPFDCVAQSPVLRTGQMMLVGAGLLGAPQGALIALDDRGRILWTYTGSRGHRPLVNVLTPVVGSDGTIYVNDAAGSMHAIRVANQSMPTSSPAPQSSTSLSFTT